MEIPRKLLSVAVVCLVALVVFLSNIRKQSDCQREIIHPLRRSKDEKWKNCPMRANHLKATRDQLSRELNVMKQKYAKLNCQISGNVAESGGWCLNASKPDGGQHVYDKGLAKQLAIFLKGKTVASFGDGPGVYKKAIEAMKLIRAYDAYDGAPYCEDVTGGLVKFLDLTAPQYGLPLYDWVISIEVAEHIPQLYQDIYLDNVVRHAREGVVLSWAVPGQGGLAHVNNRPFGYVKQKLSKQGFHHGVQSSKTLQDSASMSWLQKNLNVFFRNHSVPALEGNT